VGNFAGPQIDISFDIALSDSRAAVVVILGTVRPIKKLTKMAIWEIEKNVLI
jgi:hypothetical protein